MDREEYAHLSSRVRDFVRGSQKGELSVSSFLSPAEIAYVRMALKEEKVLHRGLFVGGYDGAERRVLFLLPSYTDDLDGELNEKAELYFADELHESVVALKISGSKYADLTHRDYLGGLLALGIERSVLGDIVVLDSHSAVVFCSGRIVEFIRTSLERIANDAVTIKEITVAEGMLPKEEFRSICGTVASPRLDCVVSALTGLSRERSQELIKKELCQLDYITETRCDTLLVSSCTLSVRGYGKFILRSIDGVTKKGRIRISADKYI